MEFFVGSIFAKYMESSVPMGKHDVICVQADTKKDAKRLLLNRAKSEWPESKGWFSHRVAVCNLDALIAKLRAMDPSYSSHTVFVGSQFATKFENGGKNANAVLGVSADSQEYAEVLFLEGVNAHFPRRNGWVGHSFVYKTLLELIKE